MNPAIKKTVLSIVFISSFSFAKAQDTIYFMNGEILVAKIIDTLMNQVTCTYQKKDEEQKIKIDEERIFKVNYLNGTSKIYYSYDTLVGNIFTVQEAWYFVLGEQDALRNYKPKMDFIGGVIVGTAAPIITPTMVAPVAVFAWTGATRAPKIKVNTDDLKDRERLNHDTYLLGYERIARKKKTFRAFAGGAIGIAIGFATYYAFLREE